MKIDKDDLGAQQNFESWLMKQPVEYVTSAIGVEAAVILMNEGKLPKSFYLMNNVRKVNGDIIDAIKEASDKTFADILKVKPVFCKEAHYQDKPAEGTKSWKPMRESDGIKPCYDADVSIEVINRTKHVMMVDKKHAPQTDREKTLVMALLRYIRCEPLQVRIRDTCDVWSDAKYLSAGLSDKYDYRIPPTKADLILEEVTKNMDESAAEVVKEAMELSPTLKGLCDE